MFVAPLNPRNPANELELQATLSGAGTCCFRKVLRAVVCTGVQQDTSGKRAEAGDPLRRRRPAGGAARHLVTAAVWVGAVARAWPCGRGGAQGAGVPKHGGGRSGTLLSREGFEKGLRDSAGRRSESFYSV